MRDASYWIEHLNLQSHPEGGWFAETYRAEEAFETPRGERSASTAIYFLLKAGEVSKFHRIASDELWHFYAGSPLRIHVLDESGYRTLELGSNPTEGQSFQAVVEKGTWFGAELLTDDEFALVGCTVSPGLDFSDLEMGEREVLLDGWQEHRALIERLS